MLQAGLRIFQINRDVGGTTREVARRLLGAAAAQIERAAPLEEEQAGAPLVGSPPRLVE